MKLVLEKIQNYEHIVIYRHVNPDMDAFGSQFGLYDCLTNSFKNKKIYLAGDFSSDLMSFYQGEFNYEEPDLFNHKVLGIVVDTANHERIDGDSYQKCDFLIKIDHHQIVDQYGMINLVDENASSCSQIIAKMIFANNDILTATTFAYQVLYQGIVADSNRFMYRGTSYETMHMAGLLIEQGIDITTIYQKMYRKSLQDIKIQAHILNQFKISGRIGYYLLKQSDLDELGISREKGSNYVNLLSNIDEIDIWMAITQNSVDGNWRVSIRSKNVTISDVAQKYRGGGHLLASGATLNDIKELDQLLIDLGGKL